VIPLRVKARLLVSDAGTMIGACEAGAGIAQVLELGCKHLLDKGRLVELFPEWSDERFPLYAIYPSRLHRAAKVRMFIEFCMEVVSGISHGVGSKAR
jgi:DNA-binding transcriptional LysR family regulator